DHFVNNALQLLSPTTGEDNEGANVSSIHSLDHFLGRDVLVNALRVVDVVVHINHRKTSALNLVHSCVHHGLGMEIAQQKSFALLGVGRGLVGDGRLRSLLVLCVQHEGR